MNRLDRKRLLKSVKFEGKGLHSGEPVILYVHPSEDKGIKILYKREVISVMPEAVTQTLRCTQVGPISTVEHVISALAGFEITDAILEFDSPEAPAMDGSARVFFEAFLETGAEIIQAREESIVFDPFVVEKGDAKIEVKPGEGHLTYIYDVGERWPGKQEHYLKFSTEEYGKQIASARTFCLEEELPMIHASGLARGLDETSAVILGKEGYVNAVRFEDEPARHKLLDLIGDIYLAGIPLRFLDIVAYKSGHQLHVEAAKRLKSQFLHRLFI